MDFCIYHLDSDYNKHLKNKFFDNALTSFRERLVSERKVGKGLARWLSELSNLYVTVNSWDFMIL